MGFFASCLVIFIKERRSGKVFEEKHIEKLIDTKLTTRLTKNEDLFILNENQVPIEEVIKDLKSVNFIFTSNLNPNLKKQFSSFIIKVITKYKNSINSKFFDNNFSELIDEKNVILITSLANLKYEELRNLKNRLKLLNVDLVASFLIE